MKQVTSIEYSWIQGYHDVYDPSITYHSLTGLCKPAPPDVSSVHAVETVGDRSIQVVDSKAVLKRSADDASLVSSVNAAKARYLARKK